MNKLAWRHRKRKPWKDWAFAALLTAGVAMAVWRLIVYVREADELQDLIHRANPVD